MTPEEQGSFPDFTPEEKARIYADMRAKFTADDLYGYIENTGERVPVEDVIARAEDLLREIEARRRERSA